MTNVFDTGGLIGSEKKYIEYGVTTLPGEQQYTTPGTYSWTAPTGVYSVSVLCVGAGGGGGGSGQDAGSGGGGGALSWKNYIPVTPGLSYTVVVGERGLLSTGTGGTGGQSFFSSNTIVSANGGAGGLNTPAGATAAGGAGGTRITGAFDGGGNGGQGGNSTSTDSTDTTPEAGAGGGAGGYSGAGGRGAGAQAASTTGSAGAGGGGGGGGSPDTGAAGGGGGVGILGEGSNGAGGTNSNRGGGGSGGVGGTATPTGGDYGGGGAGADATTSGNGANGAVRIIWGANRQWPSTNTGNSVGGNILGTKYNSGVFNLNSVQDSIRALEDLPQDIFFVGTTVGYATDSAPNAAPLTFHNNVRAGDLAIAWLRTDDQATNKSVPAEWTLIAYTSGTTNTRGFAVAKVLTSSDIASPPSLLSGNDTHAWICLFFRGGNFTTISPLDISTLDQGTVDAETITSGSATSSRVISIAMVGCKDNYTGGPTFGGSEDGVIEVNYLGSSQSHVAVVYKIFNSSPANVTLSAWAGATDNSEITFYLQG